MIQDNIKTQLENLQNASKKVQSELTVQVKKAEEGGLRVLGEIAGGEINKGTPLSEVVAKIRANNPSLKKFLLNLDAATYDTRKQLAWNTNMMAAYAKFQAEQSIERDIKPTLDTYLAEAENKLKSVAEKANEMKAKVLN